MEHDGASDGSDIFWPGYVDAVTNLVLNLLFVLTIMIIAVFMFAIALSRHTNEKPAPSAQQQTVENAESIDPTSSTNEVIKAKDEQIESLTKTLAALKQEAQIKNSATTTQKIASAKTPIKTPEKSLQNATDAGGLVIISFTQDAVSINPTETESVRNALSGIVKSGSARIEVITPKDFSEAKRLAFYRAMSVRNQLIALKMPIENIEVLVREGTNSSDNSKVLVSPK
jgi:small-conductance mechanosensitive channel